MGSLQDQLMKAGLATPEQLRKARGEQRQEAQRERGGGRDRQAGSRTPGPRPSARRSRTAPRPSSAPAGGAAGQRRDGAERAGGPEARSRRSGARPSGAGRDRRHRRGAPGRSPERAPGASPEPGSGTGSPSRGRAHPSNPGPSPDPAVQALNLRIRALLDTHALNDKSAESAFHFRRENVVRRVYATDEQRSGLAIGALAIVGFRRRHHIVPAAVADEIHALRPIVFIHRADPESAEGGSEEAQADDPYRGFPVPDDLYW